MIAAASIASMWLMCACIIVVLFGVVSAFKLFEWRQLKRMRALVCSKCSKHFQVPSYSAVRRWMARDAAVNSGFYLKCESCGIEFRYADNFECLGQTT